jgi:hypothetical protein
MTNTTAEILTINGTVLNTLAKNVESLTGRLHVPARRTANVLVPGRHGAIRVARKMYDQGLIVLPMWVAGCNDDGTIPVGTTARREFYRNVDELVRLFASDAPLDIQHTIPDGSVRQASGDVDQVLDFTTGAWGDPVGKVSAAITLPDPFWHDVNATFLQFVSPGPSLPLSQFAQSNAPMEDFVYVVTGPATNARIGCSATSWVQYNGVIAAGQTLTIDSGAWSLAGTGGLVPDYAALIHGPEARWLTVRPGSPPAITWSATGATSATKVTVTGKRKYLVG